MMKWKKLIALFIASLIQSNVKVHHTVAIYWSQYSIEYFAHHANKDNMHMKMFNWPWYIGLVAFTFQNDEWIPISIVYFSSFYLMFPFVKKEIDWMKEMNVENYCWLLRLNLPIFIVEKTVINNTGKSYNLLHFVHESAGFRVINVRLTSFNKLSPFSTEFIVITYNAIKLKKGSTSSWYD